MNIYSDVWVSQNKGISWTQVTSASWAPRVSLSATSTPDGLIEVMGGSDVGGYTNDVWNNQVAGDTTPTPYHLFTSVGIYPILLQVHNLDGTDSIRHNVTASYYTGPHANFNWTQPTIFDPLNVSFNDLSTNNPNGWAWFFGDEKYDQAWNLQKQNLPWGDRNQISGVELPNGHILITSGEVGIYNYPNDTYRSIDYGKTWTLRNSSGGWAGRGFHRMVALPDGSALLMAGDANLASVFFNDTWRTTDEGATWQRMTANASWSSRSLPAVVTMQDGSVVLMGGTNSLDGAFGDVWRSTDNGATWTQQTASAGWSPRFGANAVVTQNNTIILSGGAVGLNLDAIYNDVWASLDEGQTWSEVNASASWGVRFDHGMIIQPDGSIIVTGGETHGYAEQQNTWRSTNNGVTWAYLPNSSENHQTGYNVQSFAMPNGSVLNVLSNWSTLDPLDNAARDVPYQGSNVQNPFHNYATGGFYIVSLQSFNQNGTSVIQKLLSLQNAYWLNLTFVDSVSNVVINVVDVNDSVGNSYVTTDGTNSTKYFSGPVTIYANAAGYQERVQSFTLTNNTVATVALTKVSANTQNTWWTPHTVQITIMDNYGQRLVGVNINASYNQSAMPISWIQQLYGIQSGPSADMVNSALVLGGTTGSDGTLTTTMLGSLKYDIYLTSATYGLNNYYVAAYPSDPMLNIYVATAASALITNVSNSLYTALNGTQVYFTEPDINNVSMCINYVDNAGLTTSVNETWEFSNNNSVFFNQVLPNPGTTPNLTCITRPNIRGTQVWWGWNATRSV
jgi:hypothetical protein